MVRHAAAVIVGVVLAVGIAACGSDGGSEADQTFPAATSEAGERGRELVLRNGCAACHTANGTKSSGPTWKGLAGSTFTLIDGSTATADAEYLTAAIVTPRLEGRIGFPLVMPDHPQFSAADVADIVTYIQELPTE